MAEPADRSALRLARHLPRADDGQLECGIGYFQFSGLAKARIVSISGKGENCLVQLVPRPPMRRTHVDRLHRFGVDPTVGNPATRKRERMRTVLVDHGEFEIAAERCGDYELPHGHSVMRPARRHFDLSQSRSAARGCRFRPRAATFAKSDCRVRFDGDQCPRTPLRPYASGGIRSHGGHR